MSLCDQPATVTAGTDSPGRLRKRRQEPDQFDDHRLTGRIDNVGTAE